MTTSTAVPDSGAPVLSLHGAAAGWGPCQVLSDLDLECRPGEIIGVLGTNGAGKSTLLRLLAGDLPLMAGTLRLHQRPLHNWPRQQRARTLAFLPQASALYFPFTVEQVVQLGRLPHQSGAARDAQLVSAALAWTDCTALRQRHYTQLSGGEQQRVQLARVLCQLPALEPEERLHGRVLLLDEPGSGLDPRHLQQLRDVLLALAARGLAVVIALHDINLLASMAHRVLLLAQGRVLALGPARELLTPALLEQVYAMPLMVRQHPAGYPLVFPG